MHTHIQMHRYNYRTYIRFSLKASLHTSSYSGMYTHTTRRERDGRLGRGRGVTIQFIKDRETHIYVSEDHICTHTYLCHYGVNAHRPGGARKRRLGQAHTYSDAYVQQSYIHRPLTQGILTHINILGHVHIYDEEGERWQIRGGEGNTRLLTK